MELPHVIQGIISKSQMPLLALVSAKYAPLVQIILFNL